MQVFFSIHLTLICSCHFLTKSLEVKYTTFENNTVTVWKTLVEFHHFVKTVMWIHTIISLFNVLLKGHKQVLFDVILHNITMSNI